MPLTDISLSGDSLSGIYAITDESLLPAATLEAAVGAALESGISLLQYRNKQGSRSERIAQATALVALCHRYDIPCLINDDVDLCLQTGADGVHIGQQDQRLAEARARLGQRAVIGVTCHQSVELAQQAEADGASYVAFGRFFPSHTKPGAPQAQIRILEEAKSRLSLPVVAIGGINAENGAALISAGADMLAVIHALFGTPDVAANTRRLVSLFEQQRRKSKRQTKDFS